MITVQCDRLLINDTNMSRGDIEDCIGRRDLSKYGISIINIRDIRTEIEERLSCLLWRVDRIILPGRSSSIFLSSMEASISLDQKVFLPSIRRKLDGMTPRGIEVSEDDMARLASIQKEERILLIDDVVASGTTINGIAKRLRRLDIDTITLVSREPTELKPVLKERLSAWCRVLPRSLRIPAINTLSSLQEANKANIILEGFRKLYGQMFTQRVTQLFPNPR